jgi:ribose transport system ATP-binding protein
MAAACYRPKLSIRGVTKQFEAATAVDRVDLDIGAGQVAGLIGENGAGKSTLLNILSGIVEPDAGSIELDGRPFRPAGYGEASALGVARVFQEQALIPNLRVYENILLSHEARFTRFGQIVRRRAMVDLAQAIADEAGISVDVTRLTSALSLSKRQLVEIARACLVPSRVLDIERPVVLLDEPTASLDRADEQIFFALVGKMRATASFLFVSHRLTEVLELSDIVYVLKDGRLVARLGPGETDERRLHALMVGRARDADYYHEARQAAGDGQVILEARGLSREGAYAGVRLAVRAGEILGIGGLLDSGKSELGKGLAGVDPPDEGEVRIGAGEWRRPDFRRALAEGAGYVPSERLTEGIIADFPVAWNMSLASGEDLFASAWGIWRSRRESEVAARMIVDLNIRGARPGVACRRLSGGNQQKVVLARWLCRTVRLLVLDNPTRGVDAGAKEEIYGVIRRLTAAGTAVVLITDELLELIGLSNRILIMRHGRMTELIDAPPTAKPTELELVRLMLGSSRRPVGAAAA